MVDRERSGIGSESVFVFVFGRFYWKEGGPRTRVRLLHVCRCELGFKTCSTCTYVFKVNGLCLSCQAAHKLYNSNFR